MRDSRPGSLGRAAVRDESRMRELDRKQAGIATDISSQPKGVISRVRKTTTNGGTGSGTAVAILVAGLSVQVFAGRAYTVEALNVGVHNAGAVPTYVEFRVDTRYTTDGVTLPNMTSSAIMSWNQVETVGGGRVQTISAISSYFPTVNHILKVRFFVFPTTSYAGSWGVYATASEWPADFLVRDHGLDTGISLDGEVY